jgi:hypothetical protein
MSTAAHITLGRFHDALAPEFVTRGKSGVAVHEPL